MFEKVSAFFMTGTGNSYKVAAWFNEIAKGLDIQVQSQQIKAGKINIRPDSNTLYVFTLPTHGFTVPWLVVKQILRISRGNGASAVVLPSRAGTRVKGVSLPGMEGTAGYLTALLLFLKGYKIRGVMGVDMPSNWTALHWGLSRENSEFIVSAAEPKVKHFARVVLLGQVYFDGIVPLVLGLCLVPISFMYLILAQLILSKLFFASDKCVGCELCARSCPKNAIIMTGKSRKRPYWTYSCDSCMTCMNYCPYKAVEASPILAIIFYYVTAVPVSNYMLSNIFIYPSSLLPLSWGGLIQYIYALASVFLAYRILHSVMGWQLFSRILSKLCHTHYFRRYHAPGVTLKEINKE